MPFDKIDRISTRDKYITELKKELRKLEEGAPGDFWFFDEVSIGGQQQTVVLVGDVKDALAKSLKSQTKKRGAGTCFIESGTLKMTLLSGKMPEARLKPVFKETKNFGFKMVSADMDPAGAGATDENKARAIIGRLESDFDKIKGKISDDDRKTLRMTFGKISDALDGTDFEEAKRLAFGLEKAIKHFAEQAMPGSTTPDPREKTNAGTRWKTTMDRFDKIKDRIAADDRKVIDNKWEAARGLLDKDDWAGTMTALAALDKEMVVLVKAAVAAQKTSAATSEKSVADAIDSKDTKALEAAIKDQAAKLDKLKEAMAPEMAKLESLRDDLRAENATGVPNIKVLEPVKAGIAASKKRLDTARKAIDQQRKSFEIMSASLERRKDEKAGDAMKALKTATGNIEALEEMLDSAPIDQAREELRDTVKKMAEATAWREEQLKKEAAPGGGHATGRHGAQTGMERQARRAATSEVDPNTGKATSGGITPDQPGNAAGTSQTVDWNKVKITYTEEDGKRVVKDRSAAAKAVAGVPARAEKTDTGSMWANPVLEKECYDAASGYAGKLEKFTHYQRSNGSWGEFKKLVIKMPKPKSGPGWGYAVKKTADAAIDPADAENILKQFEAGKLSLDGLFKQMSVKLLSEDGGAKMVEHATVVFKRGGGNAWEVLTQYPNDKLGSGDTGWEPYNNPPAQMTFKEAGGAQSVLSTGSMP